MGVGHRARPQPGTLDGTVTPALCLVFVSPHPLSLLRPPPIPPLLSRLKEELERRGVQVPAETQSVQAQGAAPGEGVSPRAGEDGAGGLGGSGNAWGLPGMVWRLPSPRPWSL